MLVPADLIIQLGGYEVNDWGGPAFLPGSSLVATLLDDPNTAPPADQQTISQSNAPYAGPFPFGGNLYIFALDDPTQASFTFGSPVMYRSSDNGASWVRVGGTPGGTGAMSTLASFWQQATKFIIFYKQAPGSALLLRDFDIPTETWSATYGPWTPPANGAAADCIARRLNGDIVRVVASPDGQGRGLAPLNGAFYVFTGGAWTGPFSLGFGMDLNSGALTPWVWVDTLGRIHCLGVGNNGATGIAGPWYYRIDPDNTVHNFTELGPLAAGFQCSSAHIWLDESDDAIYATTFGRASQVFNGVARGTPISAPVWTLEPVANAPANRRIPTSFGINIKGVPVIMVVGDSGIELLFPGPRQLWWTQRIAGAWLPFTLFRDDGAGLIDDGLSFSTPAAAIKWLPQFIKRVNAA